MRGTDFAGRAIAGAPTALPPIGWPPSGTDDGIQIGGVDAAPQPFDIAQHADPPLLLALRHRRRRWTRHRRSRSTRPTTQGAVAGEGVAGNLPLYQGFFAVPETQQAIRRPAAQPGARPGRQHSTCASLGRCSTSGSPKVGQNFTYNWTTLDQKIDVLIASRPNAKLHLTLRLHPADPAARRGQPVLTAHQLRQLGDHRDGDRRPRQDPVRRQVRLVHAVERAGPRQLLDRDAGADLQPVVADPDQAHRLAPGQEDGLPRVRLRGRRGQLLQLAGDAVRRR